MKLGRHGLRCLACFAKPSRPYQAWLRESCEGESSPNSMPEDMRAAISRARAGHEAVVPDEWAARWSALGGGPPAAPAAGVGQVQLANLPEPQPASSQVLGGTGPGGGHQVVKLGRSGLRCVACFAKPSHPYQAWLRGRCGGASPVEAMPADLAAAIVRAWDRQEAVVPAEAASRFSALAAALSLAPHRPMGGADGEP